MIEALIAWYNKENPQTEGENIVIQYGAELLFDNCLKILMLLIAGFIIGRGYESIVFITVFCGMRSQAGGVHAKTGWGCGLCMTAVWGCGMLGGILIRLSVFWIMCIAVISGFIIIRKAPMTMNRHCYTPETISKKRICALAILLVCAIISIFCEKWRSIIMCAVTMEVITLLPKIKQYEGGYHGEEGNCQKNSKVV